MKPSGCSTSSTRTRSRELGDLIFARPRSWPLRMRVRRSPMGSVIAISSYPSLPARLGHAGDLAEIRQIAKRDTREPHLAVIALGTSAELAAMMDARLGRVARQLRELQMRGEALFRGHFHVLGRRLQRGAAGGVLRRHLLALLVAVDLALFGHGCLSQFMKGNWKPLRSALASSSVFAEVLM